MAKESLYAPQKAPIFRETFADEQTTRVLRGIPTSVVYSNGVGTFNGTSSQIQYSKNLRGTYSVRLKFTSITPTNGKYLIDFRASSGTGYIWFNTGTTIEASSGTAYVDGIAGTTVSSSTKEIIFTGISITTLGNIRLMSSNVDNNFLASSVELFEIYDYTLTANEVANLYKNSRYEGLQYSSGVSEILNIDGKNGVIANKWNTTLTNTAVTTVRAGDIWDMNFNGSTSKLDCGSYNTLVGDKSVVFWLKNKNIASSFLSFIITNGSFLIAIDNGTWYISNGILVSSDGGFSAPSGYSANNIIKPFVPIMIAVTRTSAGVVNIYANGVLTGSANQSSGTPVAGSTNIMIGQSSTGSGILNGNLSGVRIIDGILDAQTVSQLWSSERKNYNV